MNNKLLVKKRNKCLTLETLPTDILYLILGYCDIKCLLSLSRCSKKLNNFLKNDDYIWLKKGFAALVTNQRSDEMMCRSSRVLSPLEKCRISSNWKKGLYLEKCLIRHKSRYLPWICLEKRFLWFTKGNVIFKYKRNATNGLIYRNVVHKFVAPNEDICRFVIKDDFVVSGGRKGSIAVWNKTGSKYIFYGKNLHSNDINSVDFCDKNVIISGSKDQTVKIWTLNDNCFNSNSVLKLKNTIHVNERVWNVSTNDSQNSVLVGSAACGQSKPLLLYDIETGRLLIEFGIIYQRGAGVLHSIWESNNQILSCGYDSCVRLWDTRTTQRCVMEWEDPDDSVVYCIASDHFMTILSGTARFGLTRLWDKRFTKNCVQFYYVGRNNSPVYCLSFDGMSAYIALDSSINLLSFNL